MCVYRLLGGYREKRGRDRGCLQWFGAVGVMVVVLGQQHQQQTSENNNNRTTTSSDNNNNTIDNSHITGMYYSNVVLLLYQCHGSDFLNQDIG